MIRYSCRIFSAVIAAMTAAAVPAYALVEGAGLGGVETVAPAGVADCGRNPALLPFNKVSFSAGALGVYRALYSADTDLESSNSSLTITSVDSKQTDTLAAGASCGMIFRTQRSGFGILFTSDGDQYSRLKQETKIAGLYGTTGIAMVSERSEKKINPAVELSWGMKTSDSFSFG
ncbi:MAG: hypothetical protein ACRCUT_00525, partial [Spirochaetota bacterium]